MGQARVNDGVLDVGMSDPVLLERAADIVDIRVLFVHAITADPLQLMRAMKDLRAARRRRVGLDRDRPTSVISFQHFGDRPTHYHLAMIQPDRLIA